MSLMSVFESIKSKVLHVENQIKQHTESFDAIAKTIDKLSGDRLNTSAYIHALNGAHQAYHDVIALVKEASPEVAALVSAAVPAAAPVVEAVESAVETVA